MSSPINTVIDNVVDRVVGGLAPCEYADGVKIKEEIIEKPKNTKNTKTAKPVKTEEIAEKELAKQAKIAEKELAKQAKLEEKELAKQAKLEEKELAKQAKLEEKEQAKLKAKETKRLAAIAVRANAKSSRVPRAGSASKKTSNKKEELVLVVKNTDPSSVEECSELLERMQVNELHKSNEITQKSLSNSKHQADEEEELEEEIEVSEIQHRGRSYLLSSDNIVYDDGHREVGVWQNGKVVLNAV